MGMRALIWLALVTQMLGLVHAEERTGVVERKRKSEVNITVSQLPETLDPVAASNFQHFLLLQTVFDTLVRFNDAGRLVGSLAKRWNVEQDGTLYRFELKPEALFHDGTKVVAKDVAYSFARHFWPGSKSAVASQLKDILEGAADLPQGATPSGIRVEGERVVSFKLKAPYASFLSVLTMPGYSVLSRAAAVDGRMIGSGAMVHHHLAQEKGWRLERNPRYHDGAAKMQGFMVRQDADFPHMVSAVASGETDMAMGVPPVDAFSTPPTGRVRLIQTKSLVFIHLFLLPRNPLLQDREFRRGLAGLIYSIFKQRRFRVASQEFTPYFIPMGIMPRGYYERTFPETTAEAFAQKWHHGAGDRKLRIMLRETYFSREALAELRGAFARAGLEVALEALTPQNFHPMLDSRDYDLISIPYMSNFPDPDGFMDYLHPGRLFPADFKPSRDLLEALRRIPAGTHSKARLDLYAKALRTFEDEWYVIPLFNVGLPMLCAPGLHIPDTNYRFEAELRGIYWEAPEAP
ncbi:MAG TPA: hypothetical protein DCZ01_08380 [Elusimicrobia bacterium]|nr:MAG: hypothetical protein A2X37_10355 [Elusimicrobia bacterium GWA2_66_18]HAZ08519.1 hypothetical protein [Elusimicrobiota bacterium]